MNLQEIFLFEYNEIINRNKYYGYWITGKNELIPVKYQSYGHLEPILDKAKAVGRKITYDRWGMVKEESKLYDEAYAKGWVRITHDRTNDVNFTGTKQSIKRVRQTILTTASQQDVDEITIDIINQNIHDTFQIPIDRIKLFEFLKKL